MKIVTMLPVVLNKLQTVCFIACLTFYSGYTRLEILPTNPADTQVNHVGGVPVVDIAAPSASGVSQNQFDDFNVDAAGVVINNSLVNGNSATVGELNANANFSDKSASIILNEVVTTNASTLNGATEIFGDNASYIVANPNGITCNGCGFFRTPTVEGDTDTGLSEVLLSTGTSTVDRDGIPLRLTIGVGSTAAVVIGPGGLIVRDVDVTTLFTRKSQIQGAINAGNQLRLLTGTGTLDIEKGVVPENRRFTPTQPVNGAVTVAIDASIAGAMNAGQIYIHATEDGVGVTLDNDLVSTNGDIEITAEGEIRYRNANASDNINVTTNDNKADIIASGDNTAGKNISLTSSGDIALNGAGDISITAGDNINVTCRNPPCQLIGKNNIELNADRVRSNAAIVTTIGNNLSINAAINSSENIQSGGELIIYATSGDIISTGLLQAEQGIQLSSAANYDLILDGTVRTGADLRILGDGNYIHDAIGQYDIDGDWIIDTFALTNNTILSVNELKDRSFHVNELNNNGLIQSDTSLLLKVDDILNNTGVITSLEGTLQIRHSQIGQVTGEINNSGVISAINLSQYQQPDYTLIVDTQRLFDQHVAAILNGQQLSAQDLSNNIEKANQQAISELTVDTGGMLGALEMHANIINNNFNGSITANQIQINAQQLNNTGGLIAAASNLSITGDSLNNQNEQANSNNAFGIITAKDYIDITLTDQLTNAGIIESNDIEINSPIQINDNGEFVIASLEGQSIGAQSYIDIVGQQPWFTIAAGSNTYYQYIQAFDNNPLVVSNLTALTDEFITNANATLANGIPVIGDDLYLATLLAQTISGSGGLPFVTPERSTLLQLSTLYNNTLDAIEQTGLVFGEMPSVQQQQQIKEPILVFTQQTLVNNQTVYAPTLLMPQAVQATNLLQTQLLRSQIVANNELLLKGEQITNSASLLGGNQLTIKADDLILTTNERNWYVDADGEVQYQSAEIQSPELVITLNNNYVQEGGQLTSQGQIAIEANNIDVRGAQINHRMAVAEIKTLTESDTLYMMAREHTNVGHNVKLTSAGRAVLQAANDLRFDGQLIANGAINMSASDLQLGSDEQGPTLQSLGNTVLQSDYNINLNATVIRTIANEDDAESGQLFLLADKGNITNNGVDIQTANSLVMQAGQDINNSATNRFISNDGNITQLAGGSIRDNGSRFNVQGDITLQAEQNIHLKNVDIRANYSLDNSADKQDGGNISLRVNNGSIINELGTLHSDSSVFMQAGQDIMDLINSADESSVTQIAGNDISNLNSQIRSQGDIIQIAGGNITNLTANIRADQNIVQQAMGSILNSSLLTSSATNQKLLVADLQAGGNIIANAGGDYTNTGILKAGGDIALSGRDINNTRLSSMQDKHVVLYDTGRMTAAGEIILNAKRDIIDEVGQYQAGSDITWTAGNNIQQNAIVNIQKTGNSTVTQTLTSTLIAGESASLKAGQNITLQATDIIADENITLSGHHISLNAINKVDENIRTGKRMREVTRTVRNDVVDLSANGSIAIRAEGDLTSYGSQLKAGSDVDNNIIINAKGKTNLLSVHDEDYYSFYKKKKKKFGRSKITTKEDHSIRAGGTALAAGGNLYMNIGVDKNGEIEKLESGDINFDGSDINIGGSANIYSKNDVNILAALEYEYHRKETKKKGAFGLSKSSKGSKSLEQLLNATDLTTREGGISLLADNDINIIASNLNSGDDINLEAYNNVLIGAGEQTTKYDEWDISSSFLSGGDLMRTDEVRSGIATIEFIASSVLASNNINVIAGSAQVIGSELIAGNQINATTDVGDIEILAAGASVHNYEYEKHVSVSITDALEGATDVKGTVDSMTESGQVKVTLATAKYDEVDSQTDTVTNQGSFLQANNGISLNAADDVNITGSTLFADADQNDSGDLSLIAGGNVIIQEAKDRFDNTTEETHGTAEISFVVQNEVVQTVRVIKALKDAKDNLKQAKRDYRQYKKDLKKQKTNLVDLEKAYTNKEPGISFADIVELREIINDAEDDDDWYKLGVTAAAAGVVSKTTQLAQQVATAAASTGTWGFNAGVQFDLDVTKTKSEIHQTSSLASVLSAQNIVVKTGSGGNINNSKALIQGSHLSARNSLDIETGQLDIRASEDTYQDQTDIENVQLTIAQTVYGAASGPTASGSYSRSQEKNRSTTYTNSTLNSAKMNIRTAGDFNIQGANIRASDSLTADIAGNLLIESMQDRRNGSTKGAGISGGVGLGGSKSANNGQNLSTAYQNVGTNGEVNSVNGGVNANKGRYRTRETVLSSLTSGGTADIAVGGHTQINGALVATTDDANNDLGNLNLSTNTFGFEDLSNTRYNKDARAGISTSISVNNNANPADPAQNKALDANGEATLGLNTSNIQYSNSSSYKKGKTLATVGQGNFIVGDQANSTDTSRLNRDTTTQTNKDLFSIDRQQGNIDLTIDTRLLTESGRQQIKQNFIDSYEFGEDIYRSAGQLNESDKLGLLDFWKSLHNNAQGTQVKNDLLRNPANAYILEGLKSGDGDKIAQAIEDIGHLAQDRFGLELSEISLYDADATTSTSLGDNLFIDRQGGGGTVADANHAEYGNIFIAGDGSKENMVITLGHEVIESQTLQNGDANDSRQEALANAFGSQLSDRINQAAGGDLDNTGGPDFQQNLLLSQSVIIGTQRADSVGNARVNNRQFYTREAQLLRQARINIAQRSDISEEQKQTMLVQLDAVACSEVKCANGVSSIDVNYPELKRLQDMGEALKSKNLTLALMLGQTVPEGAFEYGWRGEIQDVVTRNDELVVRGGGLVNTGLGVAGTVLGAGATLVAAPACPTTGIGCVLTAGAGGLTVLAAAQAADGAATLFGEYTSTEGRRVLDSRYVESHPGDRDVFRDGVLSVGLWVVEAVALNKMSKLVPEGVKDEVKGVFAGGKGDGSNSALVLVDKSYRDKITGSLQKTGTDGHRFRQGREAIYAAKNPDVESVSLDLGYNRALDLDPKTIQPNRRPDVTVVYKNKDVQPIEVQSKTDNPKILIKRNAELKRQIIQSGYNPLPPVIVQSTQRVVNP